jgi:hypothetical protein
LHALERIFVLRALGRKTVREIRARQPGAGCAGIARGTRARQIVGAGGAAALADALRHLADTGNQGCGTLVHENNLILEAMAELPKY